MRDTAYIWLETVRNNLHTTAKRGKASVFLRDVRFLASGVFIAQVLALIAAPLLTRLFPPEAFGAFATVIAVSSMIAVFATLRLENILPVVGQPSTAIRLMQVMLGVGMVVSIFMGIIVLFFGDRIAVLVSLPEGYWGVLYTLPILILAWTLYATFRFWLVRKSRFRPIGRAQAWRAVTTLGVSIVLGAAGIFAKIPGLALAIGQATGDIIFAGQLFKFMKKREVHLLLRPDARKMLKALRRNHVIIKTLLSSQTLAVIYGRMPLLIIAASFGPIEAGYYALAERIVGAPSALIAGSIGDVYRQRASAAHWAGQPFDHLMRRILLLTLAISVVPFIAGMMATPYIVGPIFGEEWTGASFSIIVMSFSALIAFNSTPVDKAAIIKNAASYIMYWHMIRMGVETVGAILAIMGLINYEAYLIIIVCGRSALMLWDITVEYALAKGDR